MLLALDTATQRASIALHDGSTLRAECTWEAANQHTVTLLPHIVQLLANSGLTADDITAVGVCIGPGSYTGVRIGVSVAKGLGVPAVRCDPVRRFRRNPAVSSVMMQRKSG